jgi:DHA1 family bicyclomycin/chloramphenicol resistance-like MFS transporter
VSASEPRHQLGLIALIAGCGALGPIANNLLLPALPYIQREFAASLPAVQTTVSFYLIAFAIGILFVGPLSDHFGRRPIIAGGLTIFLAGTLMAALAPSLRWLVAGRIVQAIGASAGLTVARAVATDLYHGPRLAQTLAVVTMTMMVGTTLAPVAGGLLVENYSWHAGFWLMAVIVTLVLACVWILLPETRSASARARPAAQLWRETLGVLTNRRFVGYALQTGLIYSLFLAFISVAPYVIVDAFGGGALDYGIYYLLLSGGYFVGNMFVATVGRSMPGDRVLFIGLWLQLAGAAVALALAAADQWTPMALFLPQVPLAFGQGLALPHITAKAVQLAPEYPGVAASVVGFSQQAMAGLSVQLMGLFATDTPMPITVFCVVSSAVALLAMLLLTPHPRR